MPPRCSPPDGQAELQALLGDSQEEDVTGFQSIEEG